MFASRKVFRLEKCLRRFSSKRNREDVNIPTAPRLAEPWNERKGVWKSSFEYFEPKTPLLGPDFIRLMQTPLDFSPANVRKWYMRTMEEQEEANQAFSIERLSVLGPDLAAAHFVVHRGGGIRFYNEKEWVRRNEDLKYVLPRTHVPGLYVEAIDCEGVNIRTVGLENILDLPRLRWLSLAGNPLVDDWSLDSISASYGATLQHLDLSHCPKVSHRALSCFYRFDKLDTLIVEGISESAEFKLSCMMLEDLKPMLTIKGIDHSNPAQEEPVAAEEVVRMKTDGADPK